MATTTQRSGFNNPARTTAEAAKKHGRAPSANGPGRGVGRRREGEDAAKYVGRQAEDATMAVGGRDKNRPAPFARRGRTRHLGQRRPARSPTHWKAAANTWKSTPQRHRRDMRPSFAATRFSVS